MKLRRPIAAVAGLAAAATLLAGCFPFWLLPDGGGGGEETVDSSTGEEVPPELEQYYHQTLTWSDWGSYQQTTVTVPLDWDDPTGATIELAVARHEARDPKGSLLMNPGGPGGSGFDFVAYSAEYVVTSDVLDAYDLIGFDPRGVGQSTPIECYTDPRQQDALLYDTYDAPYGSQGWIGRFRSTYRGTAGHADTTRLRRLSTAPLHRRLGPGRLPRCRSHPQHRG